MSDLPILWSFRRCPYAIRARLAVRASGVPVQLREILLRNKPVAFLAASASGTVPCLEAEQTLDESRDIMVWALQQSDPRGWLCNAHDLIDQCDGPFKTALDHTKYAVRFPDRDAHADRAKAAAILTEWDGILARHPFLSGTQFGLADAALLPFVRQFAFTDKAWFDAQDWPALHPWLASFLASDDFANVMTKYPPWQAGDAPTPFP